MMATSPVNQRDVDRFHLNWDSKITKT